MEDRLTILPPPPPALTMLWAAALARAFRWIEAVVRLGRAALRRAELRLRREAPEPSEEPRFSELVRRIVEQRALVGEERPTAVEIKRSSPRAPFASDPGTPGARQSSRG